MKKNIVILLPLVLLWLFLFPIYKDRVPAFGCFDDCFNYMGGYFLNSGKHLFSEIFYNHQPHMAYLSAFIQRIGQPENLYSLVLQHRLITIAWAISWNIFLVLRFGWVGLGFSILYETTKGYLFGERFLAEAIIAYPVVYLVGLLWKKISVRELIAVAVSSWFIVFSREPYVPLGILLFGTILWQNRKNSKIPLIVFLGLSTLIILIHNPRDYFFNVITINTILATSVNILESFVYPFLIFFEGNWNVFRQIEISVAATFWLALFFIIQKRQMKILNIVFLFLALGLANIRPVAPGTMYYEAFHHLIGYAVFVFITVFVLQKAKVAVLWAGFTALVLFAILSPQSYLHDHVDRLSEFTQNYGQYYVTGEVVKILSEPTDTLFLDGYDDLIYWQAKRYSAYPYSWYTSVMHEFDVYTIARVQMFQENPPNFFYTKCSDARVESVLPDNILNNYLRFYWQDRPTCLFVHKDMYKRIAKEKLISIDEQFDYGITF